MRLTRIARALWWRLSPAWRDRLINWPAAWALGWSLAAMAAARF